MFIRGGRMQDVAWMNGEIIDLYIMCITCFTS